MRTSSSDRFARRAFSFAGAAGLALGIDACSSGGTTFDRGAASLPAAIATGCVYPSTAAQTTALPEAGGVTGTISLAAFSQTSTTCLKTTVATGADATLTDTSVARTLSTARSASSRRSAQALPAAAPVLQVSLYDAFSGNATILGVTLKTPGLPDGTYPATVTTDVLGATVVTDYTIVVSNGVATTGGGIFGSPIEPDGTSTLSVYPIGTVLPSPSPAASATPVASASPAASATPGTPAPSVAPTIAPTAVPTVAPTAIPTATPNPSAFTASVSLTPAGCVQFPEPTGTQRYTLTPSAPPPPGFTYLYGWIGVTVTGQPRYSLNGTVNAYTASPSNTATLNVAPPDAAGGVNGALFLLPPSGPPYYGQPFEVRDASGNADEVSGTYDVAPYYTCGTSPTAARRRT